MNRPMHFEIPVNDPEAAMAFYGKVFDWKFTQFGPEAYWLATTGPPGTPGIDGGIMKRRHPQQPPVNTMQVADLDASSALAVEAGGKIVVPRMPIPGVGWLVYCTDPEGNLFGMCQMDPAAA